MTPQQTRDLDMVRSPHLWPQRPVLPLVELNAGRRMGYMLESDGKPTVHIGNIFTLPWPPNRSPVYIEYTSYIALLAEWRID